MAYDFSSSTSTYLSTSVVPVTAPPFSMMCWAYQDANAGSKNTLLYLGQSASSNHYWQLYVDTSSPPQLAALFRDATTFSGGITTRTNPMGQWNLYGLEVPTPPTQAKVWNQSGSSTLGNAVTPGTPTIFALGINGGSTKQQPWDGGMGEVAVWNVILTADEWAALGDGYEPRFIRPTALVWYRDLIRDLNRPYRGGLLTNTGGVGVRVHPPMRYRSNRVFVAGVIPPASTPPAPSLTVTAYSPEAAKAVVTSNGDGGSPTTGTVWEHRETLVGGGWTVLTGSGLVGTKYIHSLSPGVQYDFRARLDSSVGNGSYSSTVALTMPEQADQEAMSMIAFAQGIWLPPPYGVGTYSQEDAQQFLGFVTDPTIAATVAPVITAPSTLSLYRFTETNVSGISVADANTDLEFIRIQCTGGTTTLTLGSCTLDSGSLGTTDYTITGSQADLNTAIGTLKYTATLVGSFAISLTATDTGGLIDTKAIGVTVLNHRPVANAGPDQNADYFETIQLDGSDSSDADGDALTYTWSFVTRPAGSTAALSDAGLVNPTFTPDLLGGIYTLQLVVSDGIENSLPDQVTIAVAGRSLVIYEHSETVPAGTVIRSEPIPGAQVASGTLVFLVVSLGPETQPVPNVLGMTQAEALETLTRAEMLLGTVTSVNSTTVANGRVISQSPAEGVKTTPGSTVTLTLSLGPSTIPVPNTEDLTEATAEDALDNAGL